MIGDEEDLDIPKLDFIVERSRKQTGDKPKQTAGYFQAAIGRLNTIPWQHLDPDHNENSALKPPVFSPICFWYMISSEYYPRWICGKKELPTMPNLPIQVLLPFKAIIKGDPDRAVQYYWRKDWAFEHDLQYCDLRACAVQEQRQIAIKKSDGESVMADLQSPGKVSLESMIERSLGELSQVKGEIESAFRSISKNWKKELPDDRFFYDPETLDQPETEIRSVVAEEYAFIELLETERERKSKQAHSQQRTAGPRKPRANLFESAERTDGKVIDNEAYICQICNGGDVHDNNQIVFCSRCSITVHQLCYRLSAVPSADWICDLCLQHKEKGRYMACPLCTRRGGAMAETDCPVSDQFLIGVNPELARFAKGNRKKAKNSKSSRLLQDSTVEDEADELDAAVADKTKYEDFYKNLYYNHFKEPKQYAGSRLLTSQVPEDGRAHAEAALGAP